MSEIGEHHGALAHHFEDLEQQRQSADLGMWIFLATEIMFFGALFAAYAVCRWMNPAGFSTGTSLLDVPLGTVNTAVLIGSSLTMVWAVQAGHRGDSRSIIRNLVGTLLLGSVFLVIKALEYSHKFHDGLVPGSLFTYGGEQAAGVEMFLCFYFVMTGLHALHMVIGFGLLVWLILLARRGRFTKEYSNPVEGVGLYWHFVDIVWIFLFPMLYLLEH